MDIIKRQSTNERCRLVHRLTQRLLAKRFTKEGPNETEEYAVYDVALAFDVRPEQFEHWFAQNLDEMLEKATTIFLEPTTDEDSGHEDTD